MGDLLPPDRRADPRALDTLRRAGLRAYDRARVGWLLSLGLLSASGPVAGGVFFGRYFPCCAPPTLGCSLTCLAVGVPSGVWLGTRLRVVAVRARDWSISVGGAVLTTSVGCAGFGITGALAAVLGLVVAAATIRASTPG